MRLTHYKVPCWMPTKHWQKGPDLEGSPINQPKEGTGKPGLPALGLFPAAGSCPSHQCDASWQQPECTHKYGACVGRQLLSADDTKSVCTWEGTHLVSQQQ